MDHNGHSSHAINNLECDGSVAGMKGGTWKGHVGPGILFIIWGSWWAYSVLSYLVFSSKHHRRPSQNYISKSWYPMPFRWLYYTEPILKIILPLFYVSVELYLDHPDGFQYLHCPEGTQFAGRFALSHLNNWQHASTYPPIVLSGLIDLLSTRVPLPQGTGHVFLAVAFAVQSFVMGTHQKHQPQDQMVHWLLFLSMSLCFLFILLELNAPKNPLPALGRGAAVIFQGAWLCVIGKIEFENLPQWSEEYSGGAMMAPIYFVTVWVVVLCAVTGLGLFMAAVQHFNLLPLALLSQGISDSVASNFGVISHKEGKDFGRDHSGGYLELSCCDTTQHARHDESTNLLPLSIRRSPQPLGELECFETDSARHTTTSSPCTSSSGNGSPRSSTSFAFPTHHSPEDRV
ncbi:hypothetical protein Ndes2526B_g01391 [Nannochloris sp. 'desiccata']